MLEEMQTMSEGKEIGGQGRLGASSFRLCTQRARVSVSPRMIVADLDLPT